MTCHHIPTWEVMPGTMEEGVTASAPPMSSGPPPWEQHGTDARQSWAWHVATCESSNLTRA
eukprot:scaffold98781_cov32-Prasinocladus_malaysianus.AAC.1